MFLIVEIVSAIWADAPCGGISPPALGTVDAVAVVETFRIGHARQALGRPAQTARGGFIGKRLAAVRADLVAFFLPRGRTAAKDGLLPRFVVKHAPGDGFPPVAAALRPSGWNPQYGQVARPPGIRLPHFSQRFS